MSIESRLPLDSPLWRDLNSFYVPGQEMPNLLRSILSESTTAPNEELDKLVASIFHQHSITDLTYAVLPYLEDVYKKYDSDGSKIFYLAANIAAAFPSDSQNLVPELFRSCKETLLSFEHEAVRLIFANPKQDGKYSTIVAATAFAQHCCGRLLMDVFRPEEGARTNLVCPNCQQRVSIVLFTGGVAVKHGPYTSAPKWHKPITHVELRTFTKRNSNPWQKVGQEVLSMIEKHDLSDEARSHIEAALAVFSAGVSSSVPPIYVFSSLGSVLFALNPSSKFRILFRFWDKVKCVRCETSFRVGEGWWGCVL